MRNTASVPLLLLALPLASPALGQSFNIDFGPTNSVPPASYAGAGIPGVWNAIGVLPGFERAPLVGLDGQPTDARIYMFGTTVMMLAVNDAATSGDDEALIDDMLIGLSDPWDLCVWVENLVPGDYEVVTYGLTPAEPSRLSPVRVDFATPGSTNVGGAWPGGHSEPVTYVRHVVTPTNQRIAIHSGTPNGYFQAGMNGFQILKLGAVPVPPAGTPGATRIQRVTPNPSGAQQQIEFTLARPASGAALEILDLAGRVRWRTTLAGRAAGPQQVRWDGRDENGRRVAAGIYLVRIAGVGGAEATSVHKLVRNE